MVVGFVLTIAVFVICVYALWIIQSRRRFNEPPMYPGGWPVLGHLPHMIGRKNLSNFLHHSALDLPRREGVAYGMVALKKVYVVCDPDDSLLVSNQCLDKNIYYDYAENWLGRSLIISESSLWKKDRKMLMPAFHHQVMESFMETFNKQAIQMVQEVSRENGKGSFDHTKYINQYSIETLCKTVLGVDINDKRKYMDMTVTVIATILKRILNPFMHNDTVYGWSNLKKTEEKYTNYIHSVADDLIERKRSEKKANPQNNIGTKNNFLELLVDISTRETMTDKQLRDQLNLIIVAGYDTNAITLAITLIVIGSHKNVQDKIYKEITEVLGDVEDIMKADLDRLVYLEAVLKETLRLFPPKPLVIRDIKEDIKLDIRILCKIMVERASLEGMHSVAVQLIYVIGSKRAKGLPDAKYTLYAGTACGLFLGGLNMHPKIWGEDAEQFKPERWLPPSVVPNHPAAFAAFSIGRRNCIGKYFAMMTMKTLCAHVVRNYVIDADMTKLDFRYEVLNRLQPGNYISIQKRI